MPDYIDPIIRYALSDDSLVGNVYYFGYVDTWGNWYIMENNRTNGTYRYAKGTKGYEDKWGRRQDLTYDYFHKVFG